MLATTLTVLEIVYVIALSGWIALQKRSPVATLAWIFLVIALPIVGLVAYYLLGVRRVRKNRLKRLRAKLGLKGAKDRMSAIGQDVGAAAAEPRVRQLMTLAMKVGEAPPSHARDVRLFHEGDEALAAIEAAIAHAEHHVHLEYYIFEPDRTGTRLRDLLAAKARTGVRVRLLVDGIGSHHLSRKWLAPLREAGAQVAWFAPVALARLRPRLMNFRTHRKIVVVDGMIGFTGGVNVTDEESAAARGARAFRDTHVAFEGAAVRWLQLVFLEDWHHATGIAETAEAYFPPEASSSSPEACVTQVLASGPDGDWEGIAKLYFAAIACARERVLVTTPYFVPDEPMLTALVTAALRGVDVKVLVPRRSDSAIVSAAARSYYEPLLAAGVRIHEYLPRMLHAKALVVDDLFAAVGSANLDTRSSRLNYEVTAVFFDEHIASELARVFARDVTRARRVDASARARLPLGGRLFEAGARLFAPLL